MYCKIVPGLKQLLKADRFAKVNVLAREAGYLPLDHGGSELGQMRISLPFLGDDMTLITSSGVLKPYE
jgi:hypothetical protein